MRSIIASACRRPNRLSASAVTCARPTQGGSEFRPEGDDQQGPHFGQPVDEPVEHIERRRVDPMRVLQQRQHGRVPGQPLEERQQSRDRTFLLFAGRHCQRRVASLERDRQQRRDEKARSRSAPILERATIASSLASSPSADSPRHEPAARAGYGSMIG